MSGLEALNFDLLEDSFINMFKPLIYGQTALGSVRVNISYKFVTPPMWYQRVCCLLFVGFGTCAHIYMTIRAMNFFIDESLLQAFLFCCQVNSELVLNSCVMILNNFCYRDENPKLLVTMQCINRCLKISEEDRKNKWLYRFNLYGSIFFIVYHIVFFIPICLALTPFEWILSVPAMLLFLPEQLETVLYFSVMFFLCARVRHINRVVEKLLENNEESEADMTEESDMFLRVSLAYKNIAMALLIVEKTFSPFLLFMVIHTFFFHILTLQQLITVVENKVVWVLFFKAYWNGARHWGRLLLIGVTAHYMDKQLDRTREWCYRVIERSCDDSIRNHAKNTLRVTNQLTSPRVFRMFLLRNLPVRVAFTTTTYVFVLLEFAFL